jgi:hypothetical protein
VGKPEGKRPLGRPGIDWRIIFRRIFMKWDGSMDWIDLAQDRDRWRDVLNEVMNLQFHKMRGFSIQRTLDSSMQ